LLAVAAVAAVVLVIVQPWTDHPTEPLPTDAGLSSSAADVPGEPTGAPTPPPVPGEDAVFDADSMDALFVTPADLAASVPAAKDGVRAGLVYEDHAWGLPKGASVVPGTCTTAITVVPKQPRAFSTRSLVADQFAWDQHVTLLSSGTAAGHAFADLVATVDACPTYTQVNPGPIRWDAEPALEGPGAYPSIVQVVTRTAGGSSTPMYEGHMLVGNSIVTWTAAAPGTGTDPDAALATLGSPTTLNAMVQARAQHAVQTVE